MATSRWPTGWRAQLLWMIPVALGVLVFVVSAELDEPPRSSAALALMCGGVVLMISSLVLVRLGPDSIRSHDVRRDQRKLAGQEPVEPSDVERLAEMAERRGRGAVRTLFTAIGVVIMSAAQLVRETTTFTLGFALFALAAGIAAVITLRRDLRRIPSSVREAS